MDLTNCQVVRMLPTWMQDDRAVGAFASVVDAAAAQAHDRAQMLTQWDKIDELPEDVLDELAWALDISWWDSEASIETKRALIKDSDYVHSKLGTVAAMENVARAYLGDGEVLEWFDYGGRPHNFKIATGNLPMLQANQARLLDRLMQAKRHSSKLESILVLLTGDVPLCSGTGFRESTHGVHFASREGAWAFAGVGMGGADSYEVCMIPWQRLDVPARSGQAHRISDHTTLVMLPVWRIPARTYSGQAVGEHDRVVIRMMSAGADDENERSE